MLKKIKKYKNNEIATNALTIGIIKPISMLISYMCVPIVLDYLGIEKYGAWVAIASVISWISYFDVGIGNGLRNKLTEAIANKDTFRCKQLVSSAYLMLFVIVLLVTTIVGVVAIFIDWNDVLGLKDAYRPLTVTVVLCVVFGGVNFVLLLCRSIMHALQKTALANVLELCVQTLTMAGIILATCFTKGSLMIMCLISGFSTLSVCVFFTIAIFYRHRDLMPSFHDFDFSAGKEVSSLGLSFFVIQLSGLVLFTTDSLIISNLYGAEDVTPYSIVNKLFTVIISIHAAILAPFWSGITKADAENNTQKIRKIVRFSTFLLIPFSCGAIMLAIVFLPLTSLWLGQSFNYGYMILFGMVYCLMYMVGNTYGVIASGLSLMKVQMCAAIAQAIVNIPLSLLLARHYDMGPAGILLGTVLTMLIGSVSMPIVVFRKIKEYGRET